MDAGARGHDGEREQDSTVKKKITMALKGQKMCGTMDGANNNCVGRFPRGQHWREPCAPRFVKWHSHRGILH